MGFVTYDTFIDYIKSAMKTFLSQKGGKLTGKLLSRDIYVGGDFLEDGTYDPAAGKGKSRLTVSGTTELRGELRATEGSAHLKSIEVDGQLEVGGTAELKNEVKIRKSLQIDSKLKVGEGASIAGTLDMKGNDVKNIQSLEVEGTANLKHDVYIRQSGSSTREDENRYKLTDILEELTDGGFKNRYVVGKHGGGTFAEQLQATIDACPDGGTVFIPYKEEEYDLGLTTKYTKGDCITIGKNITVLGDYRQPTIRITGGVNRLFDLTNSYVDNINIIPVITFENLKLENNSGISTLFGNNNPITSLTIKNCDFTNAGRVSIDYVNNFVLIENSNIDTLRTGYQEDGGAYPNKVIIKDSIIQKINMSDSSIDSILIENCLFDFSDYAISLEANSHTLISNCVFKSEEENPPIFNEYTSDTILCVNCKFNGYDIGTTSKVSFIGCDIDSLFSDITIPTKFSDLVQDKLMVSTENGVDITSSQKVVIEGTQGVEIKSDSGVDITAAGLDVSTTGDMSIKGDGVYIGAESWVDIRSENSDTVIQSNEALDLNGRTQINLWSEDGFIRLNASQGVNVESELSIQSGLIIPSSTPGSTKKFKITVDDNGTINATEV